MCGNKYYKTPGDEGWTLSSKPVKKGADMHDDHQALGITCEQAIAFVKDLGIRGPVITLGAKLVTVGDELGVSLTMHAEIDGVQFRRFALLSANTLAAGGKVVVNEQVSLLLNTLADDVMRHCRNPKDVV